MPHENDNDFQRNDVYSKRIRAGKRRTYFFDVRTTKANDYYLTITESKKRFNDDGYDRHKVFIYKEDFNKFIHTLEEVIDHIKNNLMPDYDFDAFTRDPEDITFDDDDVFERHERKDSEVKDEIVDEIIESPAPTEVNDKIELNSDDDDAVRWD